MEIPSTHTVPLSWVFEAASLPIQYRTLSEVVPEPARDFERLASLRDQTLHYKEALAIVRKQKDTGLWGANLLAPGPSKAMGWKEAGTIFQYRRLLELGWPPDARAFRSLELQRALVHGSLELPRYRREWAASGAEWPQ